MIRPGTLGMDEVLELLLAAVHKVAEVSLVEDRACGICADDRRQPRPG